ncbi:MAG: hypothetical protein RR576_08310 [Oscillospiraceae bacterium]
MTRLCGYYIAAYLIVEVAYSKDEALSGTIKSEIAVSQLDLLLSLYTTFCQIAYSKDAALSGTIKSEIAVML